MMKRLPSLSALKAFEAVGRTRSVRAAGEELSISPTVVSRHLHNLQLDLGIDLVEPSGRGLSLTPTGQAFHAQISQAFGILRQAVQDIRPQQRESLNIWCIPGIANRRLLPRLPELQERLKTLEITLQPTLSRPDFGRGEADVEIVYLGELQSAHNLQATLLAQPQIFPVASPSFRARYPGLSKPSDLLGLPLIHEESTHQWERWFARAGVTAVPPLRGSRLWHAHLAVEAACLGQGIALANRFLVEEDLKTGRLVEIVPSDVRLGGYYLIAPAGHWRDPSILTLRNWLTGLLDEQAIDASDATMRTNS